MIIISDIWFAKTRSLAATAELVYFLHTRFGKLNFSFDISFKFIEVFNDDLPWPFYNHRRRSTGHSFLFNVCPNRSPGSVNYSNEAIDRYNDGKNYSALEGSFYFGNIDLLHERY